MLHRLASLGLAGLLVTACHAPARVTTPAHVTAKPKVAKVPCKCEIDRALDAFHTAAARADEDAYFAAFAPSGVFLGTDATERWDVSAFRAYAHPFFAAGKGWTYVARDRHTTFASDGKTAWFDELLDNPKYGELRGSGVLVKQGDGWKIAQYNLTFTIPNAVAGEVVKLRETAPSGPTP